MTDSDIKEIRKLVDEVISAPSKLKAKPAIKSLMFQYNQLRNSIDPYYVGKLREVIDYAKSASGRVKDKLHWINCVEQSWYVFENGVKEGVKESN